MTASYPGAIKTFTTLVDNVDRVLAADANERGDEITAMETWLFRALALGAHVDSRTLSGTLTLVDGDKAVQKIDCNGADRDVSLPAVATTNHIYYLVNISTGGYIITIKNSGGSAMGIVLPGEAAIVLPTGASWYRLSGRLETEYKIVPTVASNNLTLALKHLDGTDPSTVRPLWFKIGNTWRAATAALSVTKAAATNWCNLGSTELATKEADLFAYVLWNTGPATDIVDIAFSRIPFGSVYSDFSVTTTNEKYLAYGNASAPASTDDVINIGRFAATLSAGAGYTWTVPAFTTINLRSSPTYETRVLTWTPGHTGFSTSPTVTSAEYVLIGRVLRAWYKQNALGNSNATTFTITGLPFASPVNLIGVLPVGFGADNSTNITLPRIDIGANNILTLYGTTPNNPASWTGAGTKGIYVFDVSYKLT